jgi:hypothetical protein
MYCASVATYAPGKLSGGDLGVLDSILGQKADRGATAVADAEAALRRATEDHAGAVAEIDALNVKRRELLLIDDSDSDIIKLDRALSKAELRLERFDAAQPALLAALALARDRKRQAEWVDLRGRYFVAAADYLAKMRAARAAFESIHAFFDEATAKGLAVEANATMLRPPYFLDTDVLNQWDISLERAVTAADRAQKAPEPAAALPAPAPPAARPQPAKLPASKPAPKVFAHPPRPPPPAPAPDSDGNLRVIFIRAGVETVGGGKSRIGEERTLKFGLAMELLRSGAVDVADTSAASSTPDSAASEREAK